MIFFRSFFVFFFFVLFNVLAASINDQTNVLCTFSERKETVPRDRI